MVLTSFFFFAVSCLILVISGGYLVKLIIKIATFLKLSEFVVAFIIMAFSTSIPELFVGISAALNKNPGLSLGNVIGSNIADLTLVIGSAALLGKGLKVKNPFIKRDSLFMFIVVLIPMVLMAINQSLSRLDGVLLIGVFIAYSIYLVNERKEIKKQFVQEGHNHIFVTTLFFILCLLILFFSAHFVVKYATELALGLSMPPILIGLFLVAFGTSLPELVFEIRSMQDRKGDLALGDAMGSVVCNSTLVLGVTALIYPITTLSFSLFETSGVFMVIITFIFIMLVRSKKGLSIMASLFLILSYILFILFEFYLKSKII
ncbi:MAG: sodium:calcium antiporter [Candidatus Woesearchaeota archaeon]